MHFSVILRRGQLMVLAFWLFRHYLDQSGLFSTGSAASLKKSFSKFGKDIFSHSASFQDDLSHSIWFCLQQQTIIKEAASVNRPGVALSGNVIYFRVLIPRFASMALSTTSESTVLYQPNITWSPSKVKSLQPANYCTVYRSKLGHWPRTLVGEMEDLIPLQRCSKRILPPQLTGLNWGKKSVLSWKWRHLK